MILMNLASIMDFLCYMDVFSMEEVFTALPKLHCQSFLDNWVFCDMTLIKATYGTGSECVSMCSVWLTGASGCFKVWLWRGCGIKVHVIKSEYNHQQHKNYSVQLLLYTSVKYFSES
jgi:hypothetical protein